MRMDFEGSIGTCCWRVGAALLMVALALPIRATAQDASLVVAKVIRLTGKARLSDDGKTWRTLNVGEVLKPGAYVQTAKTGSALDIQIGGASGGSANVVRLFSDTALGVKKLNVTPASDGRGEQTELDLLTGEILGIINKLPGSSEYNVLFPSGIAGIQGNVPDVQGTVYVLKASGELSVLTGKMVVSLASGQTVTQVVNAGQRFEPASGQVTSLPADAPERRLWPLQNLSQRELVQPQASSGRPETPQPTPHTYKAPEPVQAAPVRRPF